MSGKVAKVAMVATCLATAVVLAQFFGIKDVRDILPGENVSTPKETSTVNTDAPKPQHKKEFDCLEYLNPIKGAAEKLTFSAERDKVYSDTIPVLIANSCLEPALEVTALLIFSEERDNFHKAIYRKAIENKEMTFAEEVIQKLIFSEDRDEGRKLIIEAASKT
ncbi:TPA: hypothetical protein NJ621_004717 [Vibrio parahaemolyticus]|nr:hypothetical protein [Vibrio parahaemolyticus]HCG9204706.1 hypothetical protein [Vibrio parahaemolyticus]